MRTDTYVLRSSTPTQARVEPFGAEDTSTCARKPKSAARSGPKPRRALSNGTVSGVPTVNVASRA
jgi:hypothetical protein